MCGILGIINLENQSRFGDKILEKMTKTMTHRGPDAHDTYIDDKVALGHRRLSIIDLSMAGKQPMSDSTGNILIVINGEIYNYMEIRQELASRGYEFSTQTDTEVVLNAYLEYGINCLEKFIGMFAFAIYDKSKSIYCQRSIGNQAALLCFIRRETHFSVRNKSNIKLPRFPRHSKYDSNFKLS
ncbi:MAG: hypothetical protein O6943_03905 [Bacteroidetes bacterium]|nr:hypothetical protein [Bacteroidota bacterium]